VALSVSDPENEFFPFYIGNSGCYHWWKRKRRKP